MATCQLDKESKYYYRLDLLVIEIGFTEPGRFRWPDDPPMVFVNLLWDKFFRCNSKSLMKIASIGRIYVGTQERYISCNGGPDLFMMELPSARLVIQAIVHNMTCHLHLGLEWECKVSLHSRKYVVDSLLRYSVPTYCSSA